MKKDRNLCVIMADITEDYRDDYLVGLEKQANRMGYVTTVFSMPLLNQLKTGGEESVYELIDYDRYDGVVFFEKSFSAHKSLAKRLEKEIAEKCHKPVVVIGNSTVFPDVFTGDHSRNIEQLTDHIIEQHGCELLYLLGGYHDFPTNTDKGFVNSLKKHGIHFTDDNMFYGGFWRECADNLAKDIACGAVEKPDAVICYSDIIAFFFIKALAKYGIRVPEDIIVAGYSAAACSQNGIISITTCTCDAEYIGRMAAACLHSRITGEEPPAINRPRANIITGMSCGCGSNQHIDMRFRLELQEKRSIQDICYANSELDEKLLECTDYVQLSDVIAQTHYLIADKSLMSVNLHLNANTSRCIYMTDSVGTGNFTDFYSSSILPYEPANSELPNNLHVLPVVFRGRCYGYVTVGYNEPVAYNLILKEYIKRLAISLEVMKLRGIAEAVSSHDTEQVVTEDKHKLNTVFVSKGDALHKVSVDNVLFFETEGRTTMAVMKTGRYAVRSSLTQLEQMLDKDVFMRVSKSALLNLTKVISYSPGNDRTLLAALVGNVTVRVSRKCVPEFKERLAEV